MKRMMYLWVVMIIALAGCQNQGTKQNNKTTEQDVKKAEAALFNADHSTNKEAVPEAIATFHQFAVDNPEDALAPEYLFKALEVSVNTKQDPAGSVLLCEKLLEKYPDFDKNPVALFMLASFVYDDQMDDMDQARATYQRIIDNYPDSPFAKDAAISIGQLGMSPDDLVKMFEETENGERKTEN